MPLSPNSAKPVSTPLQSTRPRYLRSQPNKFGASPGRQGRASRWRRKRRSAEKRYLNMSTTYDQGVTDALADRGYVPVAATQPVALNKVSWGAIFAGVVVALVIQVLLTMLGAGIGIATLDPNTGDNPAASTFSIVAGVWYLLSGIVSAFAGGYVAARMSGKTNATTGAFHGLTT